MTLHTYVFSAQKKRLISLIPVGKTVSFINYLYRYSYLLQEEKKQKCFSFHLNFNCKQFWNSSNLMFGYHYIICYDCRPKASPFAQIRQRTFLREKPCHRECYWPWKQLPLLTPIHRAMQEQNDLEASNRAWTVIICKKKSMIFCV